MPGELRAAALAADYAPWLVANLHLADWPEERHGAAPSWDNVFYDSPGLGYVTATHQLIRRQQRGTVLPITAPCTMSHRPKGVACCSRRRVRPGPKAS